MYQDAIKVLNLLNENGYLAYIVGGYPRNTLLGITSVDIDICTSARPDVIKDLFTVIADNSRFGSMKIKYNNNIFEITTFRKDKYENTRFPKIEYVNTLEEDLKRRDFTINTICIDKAGNYIDLLGARDDIEKRLIKTVKDADISLKEDPLRILRAKRFKETLGFSYDINLEQAINNNEDLLDKLSMKQQEKELMKW